MNSYFILIFCCLTKVIKTASDKATTRYRLARQRNQTQPIFFSNEAHQMSNGSQQQSASTLEDTNGLIHCGHQHPNCDSKASTISARTFKDFKTSLGSQQQTKAPKKTDFISLSDILGSKSTSSEIKLAMPKSPALNSRHKKNDNDLSKNFY